MTLRVAVQRRHRQHRRGGQSLGDVQLTDDHLTKRGEYVGAIQTCRPHR
jgi:hypothetical protein